MKPLLLVTTGSPSERVIRGHGDFEDWFLRGLGLPREAVRAIRVDRGASLPSPKEFSGAVVTGSSAMVTDREPWSERTAGWLGEAVASGLPVLGVCYGHQLLAHALGGTVGDNPRGREIGTIRIRLLPPAGDDPLLAGLPPEIAVQATHLQSVLELPPGAVRLAASGLDPVHAFRYGASAWGLQFHPEFRAAAMRSYIEEKRQVLAAEGLDPDGLLAGVADSPWGDLILNRFAARCGALSPPVPAPREARARGA